MLLDEVAESGVFTHAGKNALQSVLDSNLHEVFVWISAKRAKEKAQKVLLEYVQNKRK